VAIRTLITGAAGFTGRYLARLLADQGHEVHGLGQAKPEEPVPGLLSFHSADLAQPQELERAIAEVRPDNVVHLAAIAFVAHGDVDEMYRTNIVGTRHLLDALARSSQAPGSVLVASSANIYGNARAGVLDESVPPSPANDYGVTKASMEQVASLYRERLPIIIVRPFNYTGRGQSPNFLIPKIVSHARKRAVEIELGNLDVARDFSDVRTVVDAYARLLAAEKAVGGTFNVCSGRATSLGEVLDMVRRISGHDLQVRVNPAFVRPDEVRSLSGSAARLESVIGPTERRPLEDTLRWMLEE
jgi:nucleoside-diphosphate-sugar epimerase